MSRAASVFILSDNRLFRASPGGILPTSHWIQASGDGDAVRIAKRSSGDGESAMKLGARFMKTLLFSCVLVACLAARAQSNPQNAAAVPDLARQNMGRVAASASQIEAVLHKDSGLMVELKRWIAKDATDHGQLISDSDLTDQAIYSRLETDVQFRSVATALLQKFGYLLPQINPNSPEGKEQELLIQERVKWLAQDEEERLTAARQLQRGDLQQTQGCDPRGDTNCNLQRPNAATSQPQETGAPGLFQPWPSSKPNEPMEPQHTLPALEEAQVVQAGVELGTQSAYGSILPGLADISLAGPGTLTQASARGASAPALSRLAQMPPSALGLPDLAIGEEDFQPGIEANAAPQEHAAAQPSAPTNAAGGGGSGSEPYEMLRQPNPYLDVPSLYDMYLQATPQPTKPERFGMDVFQNGTRDAQMIPFDLPVGPDYVVGPGDSLAIDLWGGVSQRMLRTVDNEGRVTLPEAGPVLVAGKSLAQVQESVQKTLRSQFRDVSADVSLSRLRTIRIYVVGDVKHPGA